MLAVTEGWKLFSLFMNDFPSCLQYSKVHLYVDDAQMMRVVVVVAIATLCGFTNCYFTEPGQEARWRYIDYTIFFEVVYRVFYKSCVNVPQHFFFIQLFAMRRHPESL